MRSDSLWHSSVPSINDTPVLHGVWWFMAQFCPQSLYHWHTCATNTSVRLYLLTCTAWGLMVFGTVLSPISHKPVRQYLPTCTVLGLMLRGTFLSPVVSPVSVSSTHLSQCICLPVLYEVWWYVAQFCPLYQWHTCQTVPASLHCMSSDGVLHSSVSCTTNTSVRLYLFTCTAWGLMVFGTVLSPVSLTRLWDSTCLPVLC